MLACGPSRGPSGGAQCPGRVEDTEHKEQGWGSWEPAKELQTKPWYWEEGLGLHHGGLPAGWGVGRSWLAGKVLSKHSTVAG